MDKRQRKERLDRRRQHVHDLKKQLKLDVAETDGNEKQMEERGYLPTAIPGKWRRMTKNERQRYEETKNV